MSATAERKIPLVHALPIWGRVAALSFGGPAGQIAVMHRILVDEKNWVEESRFLHALSFCSLLPGPEAQQLAIYCGWLLSGVPGGFAAGTLFVLPGALTILVLGLIYAAYGHVPTIAAIFFGLKCGVVAIVLQAVRRMTAKSLRGPALQAIAAAAFLLIYGFGVPFPGIVALAALAGTLAHKTGLITIPAVASGRDDTATNRREARTTRRAAFAALAAWLAPVLILLATLGPGAALTRITLFFSKMAFFGFGGAYAVLAYVAQYAVETAHFLAPGEMLDGLGLAETTPGPLVIVTQFVGMLAAWRNPAGLSPAAAAILGGLLTTWTIFAPCFFWVFLGAPYVERLRSNRRLGAALAGVMASIVGVILNLAVFFALHTWFAGVTAGHPELPILATANVPAILLSVAAASLIFYLRAGMMVTLGVSAAAGLLLHLGGIA